LTDRLWSIPELEPLQVRGLASFVFEGLFSSGINDVDVFREFHEKYLQQRRIGELMQADGDQGVAESDLFELFPALSRAFRGQDSRQILLLMDGFFSRVMLSTGLAVDAIKAHIHLLLAFLARESVTQGRQSLDRAVTRHFQHFRELDDLSDLADICYWTSVRVRRYVESLDETSEAERSISDRVLDWLDANFWRKVTLADASRHAGASVSGIVHALRRDTGRTFHEHLLAARMQEARRLLAETDEHLAAVALRCGFCDQSHFTRVFKAQSGFSPGRYRRLARRV
jgi:AraC-like DNA-binding protein